ncbi:hypothetical protein KRR40_10755 [Niabella defluvii]|nr:hypothetical protein KRR40_10755 [Niabella sp. I65]
MNIKQHIAHHLVEVHRGGNWTDVSIAGTLKDVSWQQALMITLSLPTALPCYYITLPIGTVLWRFAARIPNLKSTKVMG